MEARYTYRLRVSPLQAARLHEVFDSCRVVWNIALGRWTELWSDERLGYTFVDACAELTDWRSRFDWLAAVPSVPQQQMLRRLAAATAAFTDPKNPAGRPRFKKKKTVSSANWSKSGFGLKGGRLCVAVAGGRIPLRVVWSRPLPSVPTSVAIYEDRAGRWFASFVVRIQPAALAVTGVATGLDLGITVFATTEYADADIANPRYARSVAVAVARSKRNVSRKQPGSKGRRRAERRRARITGAVAARRSDFAHKQARTLVRRFDTIGVEALSIRRMLRRTTGAGARGRRRSIGDAGWGNFLAVLDWHAKKSGREVVHYNPRDTSQTCSCCGAKAKPRLALADRVFRCAECGLVEDRDRNAARNLNPNRRGKPGVGVEGSKTLVPVGTGAA